jgi:Rho GDP-dissociation inhibitor
MAPTEEELLPENTSGYKLSQPKHSLAEYNKMGKFNGRSLRCRPSLSFPDNACVRDGAR